MFNKIIIDFFGKTPKKAKRVRNIATLLFVVAGALWAANSELAMPDAMLTACKFITVIGGAIGLGAQSRGVK